MKVIVLGVGRSGTSALFNLLQDMYVDQYGKTIDFVYEPFLWERKVFNKLYTEITDEFSCVSSLSIDGIYNNKHIPLFVEKDEIDTYKNNNFLNNLFIPSKNQEHLLAKYIRGNGRYLLLKEICPDCKFIFMMRNPLDTLNSSINMFSFLGDDFYESDWETLKNEVSEKFNDNLNGDTQMSKELSYWYYMNKFLLENSTDDNVFKICYEDYNGNKEKYIRNMCNFLNIEFKDSYYEKSLAPIGPVFSKKVNIDKNDYNEIEPFLEKYKNLVEQYLEDITIDTDKIKNKYKNGLLAERKKIKFVGKNSLNLRNILNKNTESIETHKNLIAKIYGYIKG